MKTRQSWEAQALHQAGRYLTAEEHRKSVKQLKKCWTVCKSEQQDSFFPQKHASVTAVCSSSDCLVYPFNLSM